MPDEANPLACITRGKIRRPPILGIAGPPGIGKTTFACGAPAPIVIPTEDGSGELDVARFPICRSMSDVLTHIKTLGTNEHEFKTVVLDSLDHLEPLVWAQTCSENGKQSIEAFGYGKGYVEALRNWKLILDGLVKLRDRKNMGVVLISHVRVKKFEDPNSDGWDRFVPKLHTSAAELAIETCEAWGFANWETTVISTTNENRKRGVGQGNRLIYWEARPGYIAKNRFNLPVSMPLSWTAFAEAMQARSA